jgi:non-ribosomal peptide synthase protein (TIGR01720 family)
MLGGDAIKAIRIVSKLREAGYELNVRDLMKNPTISSAGRIIKNSVRELRYDQGEIVGEVQFTPIQKWFFESDFPKPNHFNQSIMLKTMESLGIEAIGTVLDAIVKHHDILRAVYRKGKQEIMSVESNSGYELCEYDYRGKGIEGRELAKEIGNRNNALQASINLEAGPLIKVGLFRTDNANHLMICIHHLAVDGVSWRIFMEDMEIGLGQYLSGMEIKFSEKTASYKDWASALREYSESKVLKQEIKYWRQVAGTIQEGMIQQSDTGERGLGRINVALEKEETEKLLYQSGKAFGTEINDLLLSGLGLAMRNLTGQEKLSVNLEGHGREAIHKRIDIDRTLGWFTIIYPIVVSLGDDVKDMIISTKEMLRKVPNKGLGYGVLKYLSKERFDHEEAQVTFNYMGSIDGGAEALGLKFGVSGYNQGIEVAEGNIQKDIISLNCIIAGGRLNISIGYRKDKLTDEEANRFGELYKEALKDVVDTCMTQEEMVKTLSDFALSEKKISQVELEKWLKEF